MKNDGKSDDELNEELRALSAQTPPAGDDFVGAVMRRVALRRAPRRSLWQALWTPRQLTLSLRPASLFGTGLLIAIGLVAVLRLPPRDNGAGRDLAREPAPIASAEVLVRFSLHAGDARRVSLAGDFNGWRSDALPLTRGPDGTWSTTVPLPRGSWTYSFVVDGKWVSDPTAEAWRDDGFGGRNAVMRIGG